MSELDIVTELRTTCTWCRPCVGCSKLSAQAADLIESVESLTEQLHNINTTYEERTVSCLNLLAGVPTETINIILEHDKKHPCTHTIQHMIRDHIIAWVNNNEHWSDD